MTSTTTATVRIPSVNLPRLEDEVAQLNRRAERLGVEPMTLTVHSTEVVTRRDQATGVDYKYEYSHVSITGACPVLNGWKLVARKTPVVTLDAEGKEQTEYLLAAVPGQDVPNEYRHNGTGCDHCHTARYRKDVFVLRHEDGRTVQVGRQCIADFLGHGSPDAMLNAAEWITDASGMLDEAGDEGWGCSHGERGVSTALYLAITSVCIRKLGWVSKGMAMKDEEEGRRPRTPTAGISWDVAMRPSDREVAKMIADFDLHADETDAGRAEAALAWARTLSVDCGNDYLANLGVACRRPVADYKSHGIVASAISTHARHLEDVEERRRREEAAAAAAADRAARPPLVHVGTIGERAGFAGLTVRSLKSFESEWGVRTLVRFEDANRNVIVWWASGEPDFEQGKVYDITGTVKAHDDYKGTPQTVLQRVVEGLPKPKGKGRKAKAPAPVVAGLTAEELAQAVRRPGATGQTAADPVAKTRTLGCGVVLVDGQEYDLGAVTCKYDFAQDVFQGGNFFILRGNTCFSDERAA